MMQILENLPDAVIRKIAETPTPKPLEGNWLLIGPDGKGYSGSSPIDCIQVELKTRVPAIIALARIKTSLLDEKEQKRQKAFKVLPDDFEAPH